jgi:hypothetical protein
MTPVDRLSAKVTVRPLGRRFVPSEPRPLPHRSGSESASNDEAQRAAEKIDQEEGGYGPRGDAEPGAGRGFGLTGEPSCCIPHRRVLR